MGEGFDRNPVVPTKMPVFCFFSNIIAIQPDKPSHATAPLVLALATWVPALLSSRLDRSSCRLSVSRSVCSSLLLRCYPYRFVASTTLTIHVSFLALESSLELFVSHTKGICAPNFLHTKNNAFKRFVSCVTLTAAHHFSFPFRFVVVGAYVQWRARAIGEKGSAAEAKLEKAGPFDGMTVRRAMSLVLTVLKEVLEDDFSMDRLEMVCVDMGKLDTTVGGKGGEGEGDGDGDGKETDDVAPGAAGEFFSGRNVKGGNDSSAAAVVGSSDDGEGSSTPGGTNGVDIRDSGNGGGGVPETGSQVISLSDDRSSSSSVAAEASPASFVPRYGYFRRVSRSEMEELLADAEGSLNQH